MSINLTDEQLFETEIKALAKFFKIEVNFHPTIDGQEVHLFQLWQTVKNFGSDKLDFIDKGWVPVALRIGLDESAAGELQNYYKHSLLKDLEDIKDGSEEESRWLEDLSSTHHTGQPRVRQIVNTVQQPIMTQRRPLTRGTHPVSNLHAALRNRACLECLKWEVPRIIDLDMEVIYSANVTGACGTGVHSFSMSTPLEDPLRHTCNKSQSIVHEHLPNSLMLGKNQEPFRVDLAHEAFYFNNSEGIEKELTDSQRIELHKITDKIEILVMETGYVPANLFKIMPNLRKVCIVQLPSYDKKHLTSFRELISISEPKISSGSVNGAVREVCIAKERKKAGEFERFTRRSRENYEQQLESFQQRVLECRQSTIEKFGGFYGKKFEEFEVYVIRRKRTYLLND